MTTEPLTSTKSKSWLYHPKFPDYWDRRPLYSMAEWVNGLAFRDIQFSPTGKPVIKIAEVKDGISGQTKFTEQTFDESVHVRPGDMIFSWSGQPETSIDVFWWRDGDGWLNQHLFRVTPAEGVDRTFFYYLLRYLRPNFIGIARNKQTTGLGHVTKQDLQKMEVAQPPLTEQRAIASILGALDDKIELNAEMNRTLEAMARAIFKSWFVDFDPVRAKMEGRKPAGMDDATATLFPDSFEDSDLGPIPKGWRVGRLGEIAENVRDGVQAGDVEPGTPYIALEHMPRRSIALQDWETADDVISNKSRFRRNDILFGKLRPYFHKVGIAPVEGVCSTDILVLRPKKADWYSYVLGHVSSAEFVSYTDSASTGTKMPRTNWRDMAAYQIALPPVEVVQSFQSVAKPMFDSIIARIHESQTLAETRDALLPRIVSGEIRGRCM